MNNQLNTCCVTLAKDQRTEQFMHSVLTHIVDHPLDVKFRRLNMDSAPVRHYVVDNKASFQLMEILGFKVASDRCHLELAQEDMNVEMIKSALLSMKKERERIEDEETERDPLHLQATLKTLRHKHRKEHQDPARKELLNRIESSRSEVLHEHEQEHSGLHPPTAAPTHLPPPPPYTESEEGRTHVASSSSKVPPPAVHSTPIIEPTTSANVASSYDDQLKLMRRRHRVAADKDRERQEILAKIRNARKD
jgi:hypothetical protein